MFNSLWKCGLVIALCVVIQAATASGKDPVRRPLKIQSGENVLDTNTGEYWSTGQESHVGRFSNESNPNGGPNAGVLTAANGDEIWWTSVVIEYFTSFEVTIYGGTGRFEGATGYFKATVEDGDFDYDTGVMTFSYTGEGWIEY